MTELPFLYIPTRGRVHNQETWKWLSPQWRERATLVAIPEEADALRKLGYPVLTYDGRHGIQYKRQWIMDQHPISELGSRIIMLDDDLKFYVRRTDEPDKFLYIPRDPGDEQWDAMMEEVVEMYDYASLIGIADRSGANRETSPYRMNCRQHSVLGMDLDVVRENDFRFDNGPRFMSDFHFILQHLTSGYRNLLLNTHCKGDTGANARGGCSEYRSQDELTKSSMWMAEHWSPFVKLLERPPWKGFTEKRIDVRVTWSRAYAAGSEYRELVTGSREPEIGWATGTLEEL